MENNMSVISENLKLTAQIRKAIAPLIKVLQVETNADITKRLLVIENIVIELAKKETIVNVAAPEVNVTVETPDELTKTIQKMSEPIKLPTPEPVPSAYEPHDQSKSQTFQYSGFMRSNGDYYIQRVAKGEQRYAVGNGDYPKAWEKRSNLKYSYINEVK